MSACKATPYFQPLDVLRGITFAWRAPGGSLLGDSNLPIAS
jgi:hypothetical protein